MSSAAPRYNEMCSPSLVKLPDVSGMKPGRKVEMFAWPIVASSVVALDMVNLLRLCGREDFWNKQTKTKEHLVYVIRWRYKRVVKPFIEIMEKAMAKLLARCSNLKGKRYAVTVETSGRVATIGEILDNAVQSLERLDEALADVYLNMEFNDWDMEFWNQQLEHESTPIPTRDPRDLALKIALEQFGAPNDESKMQIPEQLGLSWGMSLPENLNFNGKMIPSALAPAMHSLATDHRMTEWVTGATQPSIEGWEWISSICQDIRAKQLGTAWREKFASSQEAYILLEKRCLEEEKMKKNDRSNDEIIYDARMRAKTEFRADTHNFIDMPDYEGIALDQHL